MKTEQNINKHEICKRYGIKNYTINSDGSIDVDENVNLQYKSLEELPLRFRNVSGYFYCNSNKLTSLEGSPKSVGGDFNCQLNKIKSFEGFPKHIGGNFYCDRNPIYEIWELFFDKSKIEFFNDCDIIQDGVVIIDRLNYFLEEIGKPTVKSIIGYKCIK